MVNYNDINYMYDMIQKFPNKKYIVRIRKDDKVNWEELRMFNDKVNLIVALEDMLNAKSNCGIDLKYYFAYPITTWAEVRMLLDLGVSELFIDAPLTFDLEQLSKQVNLPLRMVVNKCYNESLPRNTKSYLFALANTYDETYKTFLKKLKDFNIEENEFLKDYEKLEKMQILERVNNNGREI